MFSHPLEQLQARPGFAHLGTETNDGNLCLDDIQCTRAAEQVLSRRIDAARKPTRVMTQHARLSLPVGQLVGFHSREHARPVGSWDRLFVPSQIAVAQRPSSIFSLTGPSSAPSVCVQRAPAGQPQLGDRPRLSCGPGAEMPDGDYDWCADADGGRPGQASSCNWTGASASLPSSPERRGR